MHVLFLILAALVFIGSAICWIIVIIDAFQFDAWAGIFCIAFPPYWIYFAIVEFDHEKKWPIAIGAIVGIWVAALFVRGRDEGALGWRRLALALGALFVLAPVEDEI